MGWITALCSGAIALGFLFAAGFAGFGGVMAYTDGKTVKDTRVAVWLLLATILSMAACLFTVWQMCELVKVGLPPTPVVIQPAGK